MYLQHLEEHVLIQAKVSYNIMEKSTVFTNKSINLCIYLFKIFINFFCFIYLFINIFIEHFYVFIYLFIIIYLFLFIYLLLTSDPMGAKIQNATLTVVIFFQPNLVHFTGSCGWSS